VTRPATINTKFDYCEEKKIRESADKCGISAKKRMTDKESAYSKLENVLFAWYQQARVSGIPVNGSILWEKSLKIDATMVIENFSTSGVWISRFKQCHGLILTNWPSRMLLWTPTRKASEASGGLRGSEYL
jgi:hypothetical protein